MVFCVSVHGCFLCSGRCFIALFPKGWERNRLGLTASGNLKICLLSEIETDLKGPLRKGYSDSELAEIILKAVYKKPFEHPLVANNEGMISGQMSAIGG
ncbi:MAG: hypothetical protein KKE00_09700 [Proteobacteria bacterium]|nr:hypothetical protein [Pseudomonadota bacterium]MBU1570774.1 hypothetical protein [Pseudomonadota bacterium]